MRTGNGQSVKGTGVARLCVIPIAILTLLACGHSVIVEDIPSTTGTTSGVGGTGGAGGVADAGPVGWAGAGPGPCVSCSDWLDACGGDGVCTSPAAACAGEMSHLVDSLVQCVCGGCVEACESCVMFDVRDEACHACQLDSLVHGCLYEFNRCVEGPSDAGE